MHYSSPCSPHTTAVAALHRHEPDGKTHKVAHDVPWRDVSSRTNTSVPVQGPLPMPEFVLAVCQAGPAAAAVEAGSGSALGQISQGFKDFTVILAPTEGKNMSAGVVMKSLTTMLLDIAKDRPWSAVPLLVGSSKKRTGLRGT